jgi:hypothetical protein
VQQQGAQREANEHGSEDVEDGFAGHGVSPPVLADHRAGHQAREAARGSCW